jgi:FKBP-type peptidyl-prolyl cis-trans isomerase 2
MHNKIQGDSTYMKNLTTVHSLLALTALTAVMSGCSGAPAVVRSGDQVEMSFTCRLPDGKLAVTTLPDYAVAGDVKSTLYQQRFGADTVSVQAGQTTITPGVDGIKAFELAVVDNLSSHAVGVQTGEQHSVVLTAPRYVGLPRNEEYVSITRNRHHPKVVRMMPGEFAARRGQKAEIGQPYSIDPAIPGTVSEVSDSEVVVRFSAKAGNTVTTPFGKGVIRESDTEYIYSIDAVKGTLVRTIDSIGRIVDVGEDSIGLDYGHPFGSESLQCNMTVKSIEKSATADSPSRRAAPVAAVGSVQPAASKVEILNDMLTDALSKGGKERIEINNFDKDFAAREAGAVQAAVNGESSAQSPVMASRGDLATVDYLAMLEDGSMFLTTRKEVAENPATKKVLWYAVPRSYGPETITVGKLALLPTVGEAVVGMKPGETKRLTLTPELAFGQPDPRKRTQIPLVITLPRTVTLPADEYVKRAGSFPVKGQEVPLTPYFPARVTAVREKEVELEFQVEDGKSFSDTFGTTSVKKTEKEIITTLTPLIGSSFPLQEGAGTIVASDAKTFTVDQNHPLAGKNIVIELTLTGLTRAANLPAGDLPWLQEHDAGLAKAKAEGKPAVLVLHADWCGYCKKLFSETMPDPRISSLRDRFTWIKVNSDKLTEYKKLYGQEGFPMIVLFRADGTQARKLDGYQEAAALRAALLEVL